MRMAPGMGIMSNLQLTRIDAVSVRNLERALPATLRSTIYDQR